MDYGIRLFRHVVAQVFGNLGQAARIAALPFLLFILVAYLLLGDLFLELFRLAEVQQESGGALTEQDVEDQLIEQFGGETALAARIFRVLWLIPVGLLLFSWAAVAWHRYVLAEEYTGVMPQFSAGRVFGYLGRSILIGLLLGLAMMPIMFVLGGVFATVASGGGGFGGGLILLMAVSFLASWILVRWSLILPAWSVDQKMTIGESWGATKDVSGEILVPILGFAIIFPTIQQALGLFPAGAVTTIISLFVSWIQMLVNLALLTTLYGNLVQGRELN